MKIRIKCTLCSVVALSLLNVGAGRLAFLPTTRSSYVSVPLLYGGFDPFHLQPVKAIKTEVANQANPQVAAQQLAAVFLTAPVRPPFRPKPRTMYRPPGRGHLF